MATLEEMREQMAAMQAEIAKAEAEELAKKQAKAYGVVASMLPGITEHIDAVTEATKAKDPTAVRASVAGLVGYVQGIQDTSREAFGGEPRKARVTATGTRNGSTYGEQALAWLADHEDQTVAQIMAGIGAPQNGATSAAVSRLLEQGKVVLTSPEHTTRRYSLATADATA